MLIFYLAIQQKTHFLLSKTKIYDIISFNKEKDMTQIDFRALIEPRDLSNDLPSYRKTNIYGYAHTYDDVYVDTCDVMKRFPGLLDATDYVKATFCDSNYIMTRSLMVPGTGKASMDYKKLIALKLRFDSNSNDLKHFTHVDAVKIPKNFGSLAVRPSVTINAKVLQLYKTQFPNLFPIYRSPNSSSKDYYVIELGFYPQSLVNPCLASMLETKVAHNLSYRSSPIFFFDTTNPPIINTATYSINGKKYVRVGRTDKVNWPEGTNYMWFNVEPIKWIIKNWEYVPSELNPNSNSHDTYLNLITERPILSCHYTLTQEKNGILWQNSTIRAFLNGIMVNDLKNNGNTHFKVKKQIYPMINFIESAFTAHSSFVLQHYKHTISDESETKKQPTSKKTSKTEGSKKNEAYNSKLESFLEPIASNECHFLTKNESKSKNKINIVTSNLSIDQQIEFYFKNGKSFMLHGPSGVGKSRRVKEIDPTFVPITLRNGMLPEEVIGKTIYPNNDKTKAGIWKPPHWYEAICKISESEPNKNHILFIDEVTNVRPTEQSLIYHIVLHRSIAPNVGILPKNVVVVCAGNDLNESQAAYPMAEPLFRRFDAHITLPLDIEAWTTWGRQLNKQNQSRQNIHPIVLDFVNCNPDVFYTEYDSDNKDFNFAIDPRGWEQISDIIYDNDNTLYFDLLKNKMGEKIAYSFIDFALKAPAITINDILKGDYNLNDIPKDFNESYTLALSFLSCNYEQLASVREFIKEHLNEEILAMFEAKWIADDVEKALYLRSLHELEIIEDNKLNELQNEPEC